jgi:hypothetical protein
VGVFGVEVSFGQAYQTDQPGGDASGPEPDSITSPWGTLRGLRGGLVGGSLSGLGGGSRRSQMGATEN